MATREELHRLVDRLPESEVPYVQRVLEYYVQAASDPVLRALATAPLDDEPETEEEREAVQVAREEIARGEVIRDADLDDWLERARAGQQP